MELENLFESEGTTEFDSRGDEVMGPGTSRVGPLALVEVTRRSAGIDAPETDGGSTDS